MMEQKKYEEFLKNEFDLIIDHKGKVCLTPKKTKKYGQATKKTKRGKK